jgi:hypothetical protein
LNELLHNLVQNLNTLQKNLPTPQYGLGFKCPHAERLTDGTNDFFLVSMAFSSCAIPV